MAVTQYIGARYMPIFADPAEHSPSKSYEPLTIVLHEGNSYTSKQFVPVGIEITNEAYWAETGNYNAQVEAYRRQAEQAEDRAADALLAANTAQDAADAAQTTADEAKEAATSTANIYTESGQAKSGTLSGAEIIIDNNRYIRNYKGLYTGVSYTNRNLDIPEILEEVEAIGFKRDDGTYMTPSPHGNWSEQSGNPMGALCCAASYLNRGIVYGRANGLFNTVTVGGTAQAMVCSDMVFAAMMGLEYSASKFVAPYNAISQYKTDLPYYLSSQLAPIDKDAWITREMAAAYAASGKLFRVNPVATNLQPGDILFTATDTGGGYYLDIGHCALVLSVHPELQEVDVIESGGLTRDNVYCYTTNTDAVPSQDVMGPIYCTVNIQTNGYTYYAARPNWPSLAPRLIHHSIENNISKEVTSTASLVKLFDATDFPMNSIIELKIHSKDMHTIHESGSSSFIRFLMAQGNTGAYRIGRYYSYNKDMPSSIVIYGIANFDGTNDKRIALNVSSSKSATISLDYELNIYSL